LEGLCQEGQIWRKNGAGGRDGAPISPDGVAVHPDCWCVCLCYLHFASENPEDGEMYLLVPAHPGCPGQGQESCKMVVCVFQVNLMTTSSTCSEKNLGQLAEMATIIPKITT